jgi:hypothetical protein
MTKLESAEVGPVPRAGMSTDERVELERLRREVEALRVDGHRPRRRLRWRSVFSVVLVVLGCVLTPVAGVAVWTNNQVSNTDRFVRSVSPLVADPDVQEALTNEVTATIFQHVDVQSLADEGVDALEAQGLPAPLGDRLQGLTPTLASAVTGFVRDKVAELVASPEFASAWNEAVRVAHRQMDSVLSGDSKGIVQADTLVRAQTAYSTLNTVAGVLPWLVLMSFVVGVYLARNRFRALIGVGLGVALSLVVLAAALLVARSLLVGAVPPAAAPATASGFDIVVTYLRAGLRALLVLALVVALGGFLAGRSETAVHIRRWTADRLHRARGGPAAGGPVAVWVRRHIAGLRIGAVALAVLTFVFLTQPSGAAILGIAAVLLVVLALLEFLGRPGAPPPPADVATP